jgi:hypothetical protein
LTEDDESPEERWKRRTRSLVAWSPTHDEDLLFLGAVFCDPQQQMNADIYFELLVDRLQRMIDLSEDPEWVIDEVAERLRDDGLLWNRPDGVGGAARELLINNSSLRSQVWHSGLIACLRDGDHPIEMLDARRELMADAETPEDRLQSWFNRFRFNRG